MKKERRTKTLTGLDLNGLLDYCAREPGRAPEESGEVHCNRFGWRSVAARIDDREHLGDVIAGPQAERSPYGRGAGYGEHVGDPRRRLEFCEIWEKIEDGLWEEREGGNEAGPDGEEIAQSVAPHVKDERRPVPGSERNTTLLQAVNKIGNRNQGRHKPEPETDATVGNPRAVRRPTLGEALRAGIIGTAPSAQRAVLVISDVPGMDEAAQARILDELARTRLGGCTIDLLWRPVAVVLGILNEGRKHHENNPESRARKVLQQAWENSARPISLVVLIAGTKGLETQQLLLRPWKGRLLPERKEYGQRMEWKGDWTARILEIRRQIQEDSGHEAVELLNRQTRLVECIAAGESTLMHLDSQNAIRDDTGTWKKIAIKQPSPFREILLPKKAVQAARDARYVLLYSPAGCTMTRALELALEKQGVAVESTLKLSADSAAWGALEAARRLEQGEAPYLDHLPQLDLWATQTDGTQDWSTLIPAGEMIEAGKTYRTQEPIPFEMPARMRRLDFRLKKGEETREKIQPLEEPPSTKHEVQVYAEQRPVSGYATCTVASKSYEPLRRSPLRFRWSDLCRDADQRRGINLDRLAPDLVEYETDPRFWLGPNSTEPTLDAFLTAHTKDDTAPRHARDRLYRKLTRTSPPGSGIPTGRRHVVSSSGRLPDAAQIGEENLTRIEHKLDRVLHVLATDLDAYIQRPTSEKPGVTNRRHLPATWCFVRCPVSIQDHIIEQVGKSAIDFPINLADPLRVTNEWAAVACYHGLGRTVSDSRRIRKVFQLILDHGEPGRRGERLACLSHIISRRETAAKIILENQDCLVHAVTLGIRALEQLIVGEWDIVWKAKKEMNNRSLFRYAMLLLGGLCRVRLLDSEALPPNGSLARDAVHALKDASQLDWVQARKDTATAARKIIDYLEGHGSDSTVLRVIDSEKG